MAHILSKDADKTSERLSQKNKGFTAVRMPPIKPRIRKIKPEDIPKKRTEISQIRAHLSARAKSQACGMKKKLTIEIPESKDDLGLTQGSFVKSVSDYADTSESGLYYGVTLKKGNARKTNEDRVIFAVIKY